MPPKKKQGKSAPLAVPNLGEDSAERKRVLNVLAQRRYRQRRKDHVRMLEAQAGIGEALDDKWEWQPSTSPGDAILEQPEQVSQIQCPFAAAHNYSFEDTQALDIGLEAPSLECHNAPFADMLPNDQGLWDTSVLLPSLPSTPLSTSKDSSSSEGHSWAMSPVPPSRQSPKAWPNMLRSPPASVMGMPCSFPDEAYLEVPELVLLRGCMSIATRLNIRETIWSLTATSQFTDPALSVGDFDHLPTNLRPTLVQLTQPHHPVLDLLPWPAARDRMILILAQPPEHRPPNAASPMALIDFVYDLEDSAEGTRISGADPCSESNWELGEKVFKSWWWVFDRDIVRQSNELRARRGAPMLGGSILGEVTV